ncbi:MAG: ferredoxin-NADP reductase [Candidatus Azotimanducaceae bacterium]|jgi:ferredoxin-NADP reductase
MVWDSPKTIHFAGAERLWTFTLDHGRWPKNVLPYRWKLEEYPPNTLMTGNREKAGLLAKAKIKRNQWLPYAVTKTKRESLNVKLFYLSPVGHQNNNFVAGQFLTIKATIGGTRQIRTYRLSNSPNKANDHISVKEEKQNQGDMPNGVFSSYLQDDINVGDTIEAKAPSGTFSLNTNIERPFVLIAGGIDITAMISMIRQLLMEGIRTPSIRQTTILTSGKRVSRRSFSEELNGMSD